MSVRRRRRLLLRVTVALAAVVVALLAGEVLCRVLWPTPLAVEGTERTEWRQNPEFAKRFFVADAELGYAPRLGNEVYGPSGCKVNAYPAEKTDGVRRVLFLGDSVTWRARIEDAIRGCFGVDGIEYWNAGVEGYNTPQELEWFVRNARKTEPDHVVLTLHVNDFEATPVVFHDEEDRMVVVIPSHARVAISPWWFRHSALYRRIVAISSSRRGAHDLEVGAREVHDALARLRDAVAETGAEFSVLVFPAMAPETEWSAYEQAAMTRALAICTELGVRHFDLRVALRTALSRGFTVQENAGDHWHPNAAVAGCMAEQLQRDGFTP